jgi:hypothetical protein
MLEVADRCGHYHDDIGQALNWRDTEMIRPAEAQEPVAGIDGAVLYFGLMVRIWVLD